MGLIISMKGKLIVFEGVSGTGKETQAKLLQKFLKKNRIVSHIVFHPSPELKNILRRWRRERNISPQTELYLLAADRLSRVEQIIQPALARGEWVICLRNYISAYVYQGNGKEIAKFDPKPDYIFYFDISPEDAMKRILSRGETVGKFETPKLLNEKRRTYQKILRHIPHIKIDASRSIALIHRDINKYISVLIH
jgi:dTMP kinase